MVNICVVKGCNKEAYPGCEQSFHRFPLDQNVRNKWIEVLPTKRKISKHSVICSLHFTNDDYLTQARKRLKFHAVPSIFAKLSNVQSSKWDLKDTASPGISYNSNVETEPSEETDDSDSENTSYQYEVAVQGSWQKSTADEERSSSPECFTTKLIKKRRRSSEDHDADTPSRPAHSSGLQTPTNDDPSGLTKRNHFYGFGQSIEAKLNSMPPADAWELQLEIQQLIARKCSK